MNIKLGCRGYTVYREVNELLTIDVRLILHGSPRDSKKIAEALKRLELYLNGDINLVAASDRPRCFYCAGLNDEDAKDCEHCGALL